MTRRWLELADRFDSDNLTPLHNVEILSDNGISIVMKAGVNRLIYKRSIPYFIENEFWMLEHMSASGFVPNVTRIDKYTIAMINHGESEPITDINVFMASRETLKETLQQYEVRHGDITPPNIIVRDNQPVLLDWAEARLMNDPRPDKRMPNDAYWIDKTWKEIIDANSS